VNDRNFMIFPPQRMETEFPWIIWAVGWLALLKAFLWVAYEPVQPENILHLLGYKCLLNIIPLVICGIGVWNLRKWAVWGLVAVSIGNLIFFIAVPQALNAVLVHSEVYFYSIILSIVTLLCNGPIGDILILCAAPVLIKYSSS
jgi:hypothetical protein